MLNSSVCLKNIQYMVKEGGSSRIILDNISYNFQDSKITTISGPSGSGKTTLLYAIAGLLDIKIGDVIIKEEPLYKLSLKKRDLFRLNNISLIFQNLNLFSFLNVEDNILATYYIKNKKITNEKINKVAEYLELLGLRGIQKKDINSLSGGEQQRIAIIRAIIDNPKVILCDEPTANLDQKNTKIFMDTLLQLKNNIKSTIIIATHDERVNKYGDEKVYMVDGKII